MENLKKSLESIYPKSVDDIQCVGPCYFPSTKFIHPLTLNELIVHNEVPQCPIEPITIKNKSTNTYDIIETNECANPDHKKTKIDELLISSVTTPHTYFKPEFFVKIFYNVNSLDDMFEYISVNDIPHITKRRLFDISFLLFGNNLIVSNEKMDKFFKEIINYDMKYFVRYIKPYLTMKDKKISIKKKDDDDETKINDEMAEKYIRAKLLSDEKRRNILLRFIRNESDRLGDSKLSNILVRYTMKYIIDKIKIST